MEIYGEPDKLLKTSEASEALYVSHSTLRRWSDQERIRAYRIGPRGDRRFRQSDLTNFMTEYEPFK
jgi:excisionase family DNA binding protein